MIALLTHPRTTLTATIIGAAALGTLATSVAVSIGTLAGKLGSHAPPCAAIAPASTLAILSIVSAVSTAVSGIALGVAAAGQSILKSIDTPQQPAPPAEGKP